MIDPGSRILEQLPKLRVKRMTGVLTNKTALVTGGEGGIGQAICDRFIKEGAQVVSADLKPQRASPKGVSFAEFDITNEESAQGVFRMLENNWDCLDILVNAAGIEIEKTIEETSLAEWNQIFAVNVTGTFLTSKYALPLLRKSKGASIINFGSYDGYIADPGLAAYCATKGAVHALTKAMACDHGPEGIRVNAICPGYVNTPMLQSFFGDSGDIESLKQAVRDVHPMKTYGEPEDIANLVNWLACDEARYASGQLWVIDGGLSAQAQQMRL